MAVSILCAHMSWNSYKHLVPYCSVLRPGKSVVSIVTPWLNHVAVTKQYTKQQVAEDAVNVDISLFGENKRQSSWFM